ncbi:hypothetical protein MUK42_21673 [Musa troglodytarum]|uniref:Uncharacterized protein n=1 Tax=Musa troglodytarum TaxID=320322 RepID=A0A9E7JKB3_9LILI|nr:hypothetical protein MUK42_21673 [Musa troglodytarum]
MEVNTVIAAVRGIARLHHVTGGEGLGQSGHCAQCQACTQQSRPSTSLRPAAPPNGGGSLSPRRPSRRRPATAAFIVVIITVIPFLRLGLFGFVPSSCRLIKREAKQHQRHSGRIEGENYEIRSMIEDYKNINGDHGKRYCIAYWLLCSLVENSCIDPKFPTYGYLNEKNIDTGLTKFLGLYPLALSRYLEFAFAFSTSSTPFITKRSPSMRARDR